jgi:2'-5' RNA ligase
MEDMVAQLEKISQEISPFKVNFKGGEIFANKKEVDGTVVYYDILVLRAGNSGNYSNLFKNFEDDDVLPKIHRKFCEIFSVKWPFPDYKPHCTLVFLKQGKGNFYLEKFQPLLHTFQVEVTEFELGEWQKFETTKRTFKLVGES